MSKKPISNSDVRGAGRLALDAINGLVDLVEAVHYSITSFGGKIGKNKNQRTSGITGFVYNNIRGVTSIVENQFDSALDKLEPLLPQQKQSPEREGILAVLNGVFGDYLEETGNPLAIPMQLRMNGIQVNVNDPVVLESLKKAKGKIVLLLHGSCMNDLQWNRMDHDHGKALKSDLGYMPIYLNYNTGKHISMNGRELSALLESFFSKIEMPIELVIVAHSMGGLVARSACYYAGILNHGWIRKLKKMIFLGTPHHGAPLEQLGNWIDNLLEKTPYSAPFSRLGKMRSAGITDLRYGNIVDEDWMGRDRFEAAGDIRIPVPLPENVESYTIAASTNLATGPLGEELIGDGLVPLTSALGSHKDRLLNLSFAPENKRIIENKMHLDLLNDPEVYKTIRSMIEA